MVYFHISYCIHFFFKLMTELGKIFDLSEGLSSSAKWRNWIKLFARFCPFWKFICLRIKIFLRNNGAYWICNNRAVKRTSKSEVSLLQHRVIVSILGILLSKTVSTNTVPMGHSHGITSFYRLLIVWYYCGTDS